MLLLVVFFVVSPGSYLRLYARPIPFTFLCQWHSILVFQLTNVVEFFTYICRIWEESIDYSHPHCLLHCWVSTYFFLAKPLIYPEIFDWSNLHFSAKKFCFSFTFSNSGNLLFWRLFISCNVISVTALEFYETGKGLDSQPILLIIFIYYKCEKIYLALTKYWTFALCRNFYLFGVFKSQRSSYLDWFLILFPVIHTLYICTLNL